MDTATNVSAGLLAQAVDQLRDGVTIADARRKDHPIIYVNRGFEQMTGYASAEVIGKSYRFLQGEDVEQPEIATIHDALTRGEGCQVTLRNYRKDGSLFWNELSISPLRDEQGELTHFVGVQKDVTSRILHDQHLHQSSLDLHTLNRQLGTLAYTDHVSGISNRRHFDEQFASLLAAAQRTHGELSVLLIELDHFREFIERYGRPAGDECLRVVGDCIAKLFARGSDCAARYSGDEFAVVSTGDNIVDLQAHAQKLRAKVSALGIPHSGSPHGIVTISVGGVARIPQRDTAATDLIALADAALYEAKRHGRNRAHIVN
ncbi:MAG: hypothetical protein A2Z95_09035 [Gallionellales bacterium GWA2_60_18]|nr:MAG: hypothetical protein A2Z95_09035 [Gallionellales bacterium GWA2_60_18]